MTPQRGVEPISAAEMMIIAKAAEVLHRHQIGLTCPRCQRPFQGLNASQDVTWAIACDCRELRAHMGRGSA
jgi:hypothetical protein